jgi:hypothetical protein
MKKSSKRRMHTHRPDAAKLWAEIEDYFGPNLGPWFSERVLYFHLVRRTRLAGTRSVLTSTGDLARRLASNRKTVRTALWRLVNKGAVRVVNRDRGGHRVEVKVPREIPGCLGTTGRPGWEIPQREGVWVLSRVGRRAIFEREGQRCFYCMRRLMTKESVLDHVRPRARGGQDSYWNVVACCFSCNSMKRDSTAHDFLRLLVRENIINRREFRQRLAAIEALKKGLKPKLYKAA